jgi:hypothetical protein
MIAAPPTVVAICRAMQADDYDTAYAIAAELDHDEARAVLAAACEFLQHEWVVAARDMGMTVDEYMRPLALAVARQEHAL